MSVLCLMHIVKLLCFHRYHSKKMDMIVESLFCCLLKPFASKGESSQKLHAIHCCSEYLIRTILFLTCHYIWVSVVNSFKLLLPIYTCMYMWLKITNFSPPIHLVIKWTLQLFLNNVCSLSFLPKPANAVFSQMYPLSVVFLLQFYLWIECGIQLEVACNGGSCGGIFKNNYLHL